MMLTSGDKDGALWAARMPTRAIAMIVGKAALLVPGASPHSQESVAST
jgi:hypothetical protein